MLKKLVMGSALAALMAVPAFAQSFNPGWGTGNTMPAYYDAQGQLHAGMYRPNGARAYAAASHGAYAYVPGAAAFDRVYDNGHYAGQDPDPNVRLNLRSGNPAAY